MRQLLTESLILGVLGAGVGVLLASWLTRLLTTFQLPIPIALSIDLRLDARVLGFTAGVALLTGVLAGLAPALRATRANLVVRPEGRQRGPPAAVAGPRAGQCAMCSSSGRWR